MTSIFLLILLCLLASFYLGIANLIVYWGNGSITFYGALLWPLLIPVLLLWLVVAFIDLSKGRS